MRSRVNGGSEHVGSQRRRAALVDGRGYQRDRNLPAFDAGEALARRAECGEVEIPDIEPVLALTAAQRESIARVKQTS
jgi:hypothetical protein